MNADATIDGPPRATIKSDTDLKAQWAGMPFAAADRDREQRERLAAARDEDAQSARGRMRRQRRLARTGSEHAAFREAELAARSSTPELTPDVEIELAAREAAVGERAGAERRYGALLAALETASPLAALAAFRLAHLMLERRDRRTAVDLLELALHGADESLRAHVQIALAGELCDDRDALRVQELYEAALRSDHPDLAPLAAVLLGVLCEARGEHEAAAALYELAIESEHPQHAPDAFARRSALLHTDTTRTIRRLSPTGSPEPGKPVTSLPGGERVDALATAARGCRAQRSCCCSDRPAHGGGFGDGIIRLVPMYGPAMSGIDGASDALLLGAVTDAIARVRCTDALASGSLWSYGRWSSALEHHHGIAAWSRVFESCQCERDGCDPKNSFPREP